jgi:hypothetical protein
MSNFVNRNLDLKSNSMWTISETSDSPSVLRTDDGTM